MRRLLVVVFTFFYVLPLFAQGPHPFTFEDMMALKRVSEPVPSPDGRWVLFSAVDVDLKANTKTPHVWVIPITGGEAKEIISAQDADRPRWAPDGKSFAFLSTKTLGSQVWIAGFDGTTGTVTAAHRLTGIATEAGGEIWSPDGKNILFTSDVHPECDGAPAEAIACNARKVDEANKSAVKAQIFTRLLYRHWNAYKEGKRSHIFVVPASLPIPTYEDKPQAVTAALGVGPPLDLTPGDYDSPVFSLGGQDNYAFSPDGNEVCYTSNHDEVEATSTNNDLWIVPVSGGPAKNITADNPASDSSPLYSSDGKYIAYRAQQRPGYESDRFRLMLYDRSTGTKKNLTESFDRWVGTFIWSKDSGGLYFNAEDKGGAPIYSLSVNGGEPKQIVGGFNDDMVLAGPGATMLFTRMSVQWPNEIYKVRLGSSIIEPLVQLNNAVLSQIWMSQQEAFWFDGAEGVKVEGFLVRPPNFDPKKKYPVKFLIHGGPQGAWGDDWSYRWNPELFAANGYVVVTVNPRGSTGYGQKFIDDINGDWGGKVFEDLMKGLDYAEKTYPFIDKDRECALGASYGGYAVNWILGHTDRFKCLVSHDGMFNTDSAWGTTEELWFNEWEFKGTPWTNRELYRKWSPHLAAPNFKTPTLVVHSQRDYRLDVSEGLQLFTTLQRMHVPSKMLYFPDEGHWVLKPQNSQLWWKTVDDWVDQWTKK